MAEKHPANDWEIQIPYVLGLIATRSTDKVLPGIREIRAENRQRIESGIHAVGALEAMRANPADEAAKATFKAHEKDLGYGLLLKKLQRRCQQGHARHDRPRGA